MRRILDLENKPYNKCFACGHLKTPRCDGPRTSSMELKRWCEYMRDLRDLYGLTNEKIAERADVSLKTINKIMARNIDQDIMRDTARRIEGAILGNAAKSPCYIAAVEEHGLNSQQLDAARIELERALNDNKDYRAALDNIHQSYTAEMTIIREEAQRKIQYLLADIERLRSEVDYLRAENSRKAKLIDTYMPKILGVE